MSALVVGSDFAVLAAVRAQLHDERVYCATDEASARSVAERRQPEITFVSVKRRRDMLMVKRLMNAATGSAVVVIAPLRLAGVKDATRASGARGYIPEHEIARTTRPLVEMIYERWSETQVRR